MLRIFLSIFALVAFPAWANWNQIADAQTFNASVVGNVYVTDNGTWFRFNANGSLDGGADGKALTGRWQYTRGMACVGSRTFGGDPLPDDCVVVLTSGNQLVTVRNQGAGRQTVYTRQ